jgi:hypothetical protein
MHTSRRDYRERQPQTIEQTFGVPGIWINNAMASVFSPVTQVTAEVFRRVTEACWPALRRWDS